MHVPASPCVLAVTIFDADNLEKQNDVVKITTNNAASCVTRESRV